MRIKRFIASDMRTALRMVREEQGADAVILSNRPVDGGIEVVAATDYDEALVQQALRAAGFAPIQPRVVTATAPQIADAGNEAAIDPMRTATAPAPLPASVIAALAVMAPQPTTAAAKPAPAKPAAPRDTLVSRARAVFRLGESSSDSAGTGEATLAELIATPPAPVAIEPSTSRFDAMMAALAPPTTPAHDRAADPAPASVAAIAANAVHADRNLREPAIVSTAPVAAAEAFPSEQAPAAPFTLSLLPIVPKGPRVEDRLQLDITPAVESRLSTALETPADCFHEPVTSAVDAALPATPLRAVEAPAAPDPTIAAMRDEMSSMRQLIERQMGQFALERLRGSRARAAAYEALLGYGCEDVLAQAVASKIDPQLDPAGIQAPMLAELARMITIARSEPLDEGGVIALVGPTGAGKTTTAAKLAARFALRHRARDVALVTTDGERAGAREQLHAHGRRLGITVCEAAGPEALHDALEQLTDYPLVLVDTAGYAARDRALFGQILWLRSAARRVRSLLVLPANAHPHDMGEVIRRYRPAAPEGVVLTKLDETGRLGSALSVMVRHGLSLAYTTDGQQVPADIHAADAGRMVETLEKLRRAADNPLATEDRHALA